MRYHLEAELHPRCLSSKERCNGWLSRTDSMEVRHPFGGINSQDICSVVKNEMNRRLYTPFRGVRPAISSAIGISDRNAEEMAGSTAGRWWDRLSPSNYQLWAHSTFSIFIAGYIEQAIAEVQHIIPVVFAQVIASSTKTAVFSLFLQCKFQGRYPKVRKSRSSAF